VNSPELKAKMKIKLSGVIKKNLGSHSLQSENNRITLTRCSVTDIIIAAAAAAAVSAVTGLDPTCNDDRIDNI